MTRAVLTIDLDAVAANWRALDNLSAATTETGAVVKADAYGLGTGRVGPTLAAAGARKFFVALAEEGAALRSILGPGPEIYILSGMMPGDPPLLREASLVPVLNSLAQIFAFREALPNWPCALQTDSGMNRLGIEPGELAPALDTLSLLDLRLVMSHLACADIPEHPQNAIQAAEFETTLHHLPGLPASLSATGGIQLGSRFHHTLTRPGIGLYGGLPFANARPVVSLSLPVLQVRDVAPGESVGYGATWRTLRPSRVATLSGGYADGLMRALGCGEISLFCGDIACPLIGRISMDLIGVDVTDLPELPAHLDILSAAQGVDALAKAAGTIGYEILTSLGDRYTRVYKGGESAPDTA